MKSVIVSIALIQKRDAGRTRWLLLEKNDELQFIVSDCLESESFREAAIREVAWQLNLDRRRDILVANMSQLSIDFKEPTSFGCNRYVALAFYNVHVHKQRVVDLLSAKKSVVWVSAAELCAGICDKGRRIHPEIVGWINKYEVVRPWQF